MEPNVHGIGLHAILWGQDFALKIFLYNLCFACVGLCINNIMSLPFVLSVLKDLTINAHRWWIFTFVVWIVAPVVMLIFWSGTSSKFMCCRTIASATIASSSANWSPTHLRGPPLNGMNLQHMQNPKLKFHLMVLQLTMDDTNVHVNKIITETIF